MNDTLTWSKSSYCSNGTCVEIARGGEGGNLMRDSKHDDSPVLAFDQTAWGDFMTGLKAGEFDRS